MVSALFTTANHVLLSVTVITTIKISTQKYHFTNVMASWTMKKNCIHSGNHTTHIHPILTRLHQMRLAGKKIQEICMFFICLLCCANAKSFCQIFGIKTFMWAIRLVSCLRIQPLSQETDFKIIWSWNTN